MNRMPHVLAVLLLLCGLAACATQPQKDHYYSLVLETGQTPPAANDAGSGSVLVIGNVQLAAYLNQSGLPIQVGTSRIQNAGHHFWAEPLDIAIGKVLARDLSRHLERVAVDRDTGRWTPRGDCQLMLEFDKFHATDDSRAVVAGRYRIHEIDSGQVTRREFSLATTLTADGYENAVRQLRATLGTLAAEIGQHVSATPTCSPDA